MKKISILLMIFLSALIIKAQNKDELLKYSYLNLLGTSRYLGMGGAFGALGADMSTLSSNPAGIALFKRSEFTFTPSFSQGMIKSDYLGKTNTDNKYNFALNNIGIVLTSNNIYEKNSEENKKYLSFQLGFAINRYNDFNNRMIIRGFNNKNSFINDFVNTANSEGLTTDPLLAYNAYLINPKITGNKTTYIPAFDTSNVDQRLSRTYSGSLNEPVITAGANYNDKLYFGLTLGFPGFNYNESSNYSEHILNTKDSIRDFNIKDDLTEKGSGFNIKFGVIYRINDWIRIGGAVHSPTFYKVNRTFVREIQSNISSSNPPAEDNFSYNLQTPAHYLGSLAFIIKKKGVIGIDYEYVDYSTMMLRDNSQGIDYTDENSNIQSLLTHQHNIRVGGELKLTPVLIRLGYGISTGPYSGNNLLESRNISGGLGFRDKQYFIDIGYMYSFNKQDYYLYTSVPEASNNTIRNQTLSFSFGYKF